ncbi:MAG: GNAT family protein [Chloroflexi bacterium]|nr:GNAT family protein [Chloroflexota bacterium]MDA1129055.1 GNAT family protein [Chloroflexota bacterium]
MIEPVVLEGKHVRLEPLDEGHRERLCQAISDGELWNLFVTLVPHPDDTEQFLRNAKSAQARGDGLAFATIDKASDDIVAGSTRFMKADLPNKRIEIGYTFLGQTWQKSKINTEAKLLMLTHAFETLHLNRVELLTDYLNSNSRRAIARLGAKEEGILRSHMVMPDGRIRDSVIYSITAHEWPGVKQNLSSKIA